MLQARAAARPAAATVHSCLCGDGCRGPHLCSGSQGEDSGGCGRSGMQRGTSGLWSPPTVWHLGAARVLLQSP